MMLLSPLDYWFMDSNSLTCMKYCSKWLWADLFSFLTSVFSCKMSTFNELSSLFGMLQFLDWVKDPSKPSGSHHTRDCWTHFPNKHVLQDKELSECVVCNFFSKLCQLFIDKLRWEASGAADSEKCFLCKHEDLSLHPQHPCKKPSAASFAYKPGVGRWRQEDSWGH